MEPQRYHKFTGYVNVDFADVRLTVMSQMAMLTA